MQCTRPWYNVQQEKSSLPFRIYGFYPVYPIGTTTNNDKMVEMPFLVLTSTMREEVESRKMQFVILDVIYSTLVQCAMCNMRNPFFCSYTAFT